MGRVRREGEREMGMGNGNGLRSVRGINGLVSQVQHDYFSSLTQSNF